MIGVRFYKIPKVELTEEEKKYRRKKWRKRIFTGLFIGALVVTGGGAVAFMKSKNSDGKESEETDGAVDSGATEI